MTRQSKTLSKHEVELAKLKVTQRAKIGLVLAYGLVIVVALVASTLPINAMENVITPLAGRETKVDLNVALTVSVALSLMLNAGQFGKGRSRRTELQRARERENRLEDRVKELEARVDAAQGARRT
jgi:hypothetical protein